MIYRTVEGPGVYPVDLHARSGFTVESAVAFKRLLVDGQVQDIPYPVYLETSYIPGTAPYPYPAEAAGMTYDGLHPSDQGNERIAQILSEVMERVLPGCGKGGK